MSTFTHGSKAGLRLGNAGAPTTTVDYSSYFHLINFPIKRDTAETTTFGKTNKTFIPGLQDATFTADGRFNVTIDGILQGILNLAGDVNFDYAPAGIGVVGTPMYSGKAFLTDYHVTTDTASAVSFTCGFQVDGVVTRTIQ